ncbi:hypothetical protein MKW92_014986 [Papaver armeniacum]|nr:hypothetical protein MKW92_014986 [Papaver armeniacum]
MAIATVFNVSMLVCVFLNGAAVLAIAREAPLSSEEPLPDFEALPPAQQQCLARVEDQMELMSDSCAKTLERLTASKTLPVAEDAGCCREINQRITKPCWDAMMEWMDILAHAGRFSEYTNNLHPWSENTWNTCLNLTKSD